MKKRAWLILVLLLPLAIAAQQPDKKNKRDTVNRKESFSSKSQIVPFSALDQRKIYKWENGQKATPAGRKATDSTIRFARVFGDSAVVIRDALKNQKWSEDQKSSIKNSPTQRNGPWSLRKEEGFELIYRSTLLNPIFPFCQNPPR